MKTKFIISISLVLMLFTSSCRKEAGEGGQAKIFGKVYVKDYNSNFTVLNGEFYAGDIPVYIIYDDNITYSQRIRTSYNGIYQFNNLRKGNYQIYAYSKDSSGNAPSGVIPIIKDVEITKRYQEYEVPDVIIFD